MYTVNLGDIKSEVKGKIHNSSLNDIKLNRWANLAQDYVWTYADLKSAEYNSTFSCVANKEIYYIDANIGRIKSMVNVTNEYPMTETSENTLNDIDPARTNTGTPAFYSLFGKSEVSAQPSIASQITIVSSSAADTTQSVRIIGLVSGVETAENKALNGIVPATTTATFAINGILGVRLSAACAGNITVSAGAATLVIIPVGKLYKMYQPVKLAPIPSGTDSIRVCYIQGPRPMISDYDIPDLPPEFHSLVIMGTIAQAHDEMYEFDISKLIYDKVDDQIDLLRRKDSSLRGNARSIKASGLRLRIFNGYGRLKTTATES